MVPNRRMCRIFPNATWARQSPTTKTQPTVKEKRAAEMLAYMAARRSGFELSVPRCFAFLGPYLPLDIHFAAGNFLNAILNHRPIEIGGDGTPLRSYMYPSDLMTWLFKALLKPQNSPINIGSDQPISIADLALKIHQIGCIYFPNRTEIKEPIKIAKKPDPNVPVQRYVPSTQLAKESLSVVLKVDLDKAIHKTLDWLKQNPSINRG